jgi:hypothetical protein
LIATDVCATDVCAAGCWAAAVADVTVDAMTGVMMLEAVAIDVCGVGLRTGDGLVGLGALVGLLFSCVSSAS